MWFILKLLLASVIYILTTSLVIIVTVLIGKLFKKKETPIYTSWLFSCMLAGIVLTYLMWNGIGGV